eukprot:CAMPEP_0167782768 /NCGR_PEP_ID=MMETSP0111_2-20121227/6702_1 /TAXON_ID=91324 /ORGANISM="Lotharella globosa, Strain CCCM811" /LENGTH=546 /DNA_ID=CAMNT_0007673639 /DNA_START=81 /DNA_END=1721 /DNA_ORIENTATION=-
MNQAKNAQYQPGCRYQNKRIAEKRNCRVNADGFGVAWYTTVETDVESCVFRSTMPSWGDVNLAELSNHVESPSVFAHVRAMTSPGIDPVVGSVSIQNCHPFKWKSFTFMHNGGIQYFSRIKRKLQSLVYDEFYDIIAGSTDSENIFALFLSILRRNVMSGTSRVPNPIFSGGKRRKKPYPTIDTKLEFRKLSKAEQAERDEQRKEWTKRMMAADPREIATALSDTIQAIVNIITEYSSCSACSLNLAVTNGTAMVATRFRRGKSEPPSLYFAILKQIQGCNGKMKIWAQHDDIHPGVKEIDADAVIVSSEPLTMDHCWTLVADSTMIVVHGDKKNRSVAGKVELIPLNIFKCSRNSPRQTTCLKPFKKNAPCTSLNPSAKSERSDSGDFDSDQGMPPLLLTQTINATVTKTKRNSFNRLDALREANVSNAKKESSKKLIERLATWRAYVEPASLVGAGLLLQKRSVLLRFVRKPKFVALLVLVFVGLVLRRGIGCPLTGMRNLFGGVGVGKKAKATIKSDEAMIDLCGRQLRSDIMWLLLLAAVSR